MENLVSVLVSVSCPKPPNSELHLQLNLEARGGIEPPIELLQSSALPLGYRAENKTGRNLGEFYGFRKN